MELGSRSFECGNSIKRYSENGVSWRGWNPIITDSREKRGRRSAPPVDETMSQERRGLRVVFSASAEVAPENAPGAGISAHVKELSLQGCYLDTLAPFEAQTPVLVKIFKGAEYFEAKAAVASVKPKSGMGLTFREVKPDFRRVLRKWILAAMKDRES
jgi:hypothetical protein